MSTGSYRSGRGALTLNVPAGSWESLWDVVGRVLVINLGFAVTTSPLLVALATVSRPWEHPLLFGTVGLTVGPAVTAAVDFIGGGAEATSIRHLAQSYGRTWRRALALWAPALLALVVIATDVVYLHANAVGAVLVPCLVVLGVLVLSASVPGTVVAASQPWPGWRRAAVASLYAATRRPGFTAVNLCVLGVITGALVTAPLTTLAALPGFAVIVWWRNASHVIEQLGPPHRART